jgi:hypothetical protein
MNEFMAGLKISSCGSSSNSSSSRRISTAAHHQVLQLQPAQAAAKIIVIISAALIIITTVNAVAAQSSDDDGDDDGFASWNVRGRSLFSYGNNSYRYKYIYSGEVSQCVNGTLPILLSNKQRLYGRPIGILSEHYDGPYTVYFQLFFVISADNLCANDDDDNDGSPAYYLSLVAVDGFSASKTQDPERGQIVWTANPDSPVSKNACLQLHANGSLLLLDYARVIAQHNGTTSADAHSDGNVVWRTATRSADSNSSAAAALMISFEGDLYIHRLSDNATAQGTILWQSYAQPSDSLMVLQALPPGANLTARHSGAFGAAAAANASASANYTLTVAENGTLALYVEIGYNSVGNSTPDDASSNATRRRSYRSPYWIWPNDDRINGSGSGGAGGGGGGNASVALCWASNKPSILQLAALPADRYVILNPSHLGSRVWGSSSSCDDV